MECGIIYLINSLLKTSSVNWNIELPEEVVLKSSLLSSAEL
jgi:hypothetical protein